MFAGARYASLAFRENEGGERYATTTEGVGITFGLDMRAPLGHTGLAVFSSVRSSTLFGTAQDNGEDLDDVTFYIAEAQMGLEYRRCLSGGELKLHVLAEAQSWMAATSPPGGVGGLPDDDIALIGLAVGGQFRY